MMQFLYHVVNKQSQYYCVYNTVLNVKHFSQNSKYAENVFTLKLSKM